MFANKQDMPNAMAVSELTDKLGLQALRSRTVSAQGLPSPSPSPPEGPVGWPSADPRPLFLRLPLSQWYVQATCATQGTGLYDGLDWLSHELSKR